MGIFVNLLQQDYVPALNLVGNKLLSGSFVALLL